MIRQRHYIVPNHEQIKAKSNFLRKDRDQIYNQAEQYQSKDHTEPRISTEVLKRANTDIEDINAPKILKKVDLRISD